MSHDWQPLHDELQLWQSPVSFWWRDDDAISDTPALRRMLDTQAKYPAVALHLAVIPEHADTSLAQLLQTQANVWVLQHGFSHHNNARAEQRKIELGGSLTAEQLHQQLQHGRQSLRARFPERYLDILVPPWNRVDEHALAVIDKLDYSALSGLGLSPQPSWPTTPRLNVHLDIIDWRQRQFAGLKPCVEALVLQLRGRRLTPELRHQPLGLMSHHLDHDEGCWTFIAALLEQTAEHPKVRWQHAETALRASAGSTA